MEDFHKEREEKWKHEYANAPGGGILLDLEGGRFDHYYETSGRLRRLQKGKEHSSSVSECRPREVAGTSTIKALISAFNVHNYARSTVETNFTLQVRDNKHCIVISFDKGMNDYQCMEYLNNIKERIICEFYRIEEHTDDEISTTAELSFDTKSFPFYINEMGWSIDKHDRREFIVPVNQGVIFNLKSHFASSLVKDVLEDMRVSAKTVEFDKKKYLSCSKFPDERSCKKFINMFSSRIGQSYENALKKRRLPKKKLLEVQDNNVCVKDVFNDPRFIEGIVRNTAWLVGMYLGTDDNDDHRVKLFKNMIIEFIYQSTGIVLDGFICASPLNRAKPSILIPVIQDTNGMMRVLTSKEAFQIECIFDSTVLNNVDGKTQATILINGSNEIYGIDFSNPDISNCVVNKIMESAMINKNHELTIDPEFRKQLSSTPRSHVDFADAQVHSQEKKSNCVIF